MLHEMEREPKEISQTQAHGNDTETERYYGTLEVM